jgi:predicted transcriptional regulator
MTKEQIIRLAGSQSELARILGITRAAVNQWRQIPEGTRWGLLNAVTQYIDHERGHNVDSRMNNAWFGTPDCTSNLKRKSS